jgi:hypothetical protein
VLFPACAIKVPRSKSEGEIDILLALKDRGFLLQDGDVPPLGLSTNPPYDKNFE